MADLKPLGSEKLQGIDKINRMIEISNYRMPLTYNNEVLQENNGKTEYQIKLADGLYYGIVKETKGYILKISEDTQDWTYLKTITERKYYNSYSQALKRLNIIVSETSRNVGHNSEIPLIGEQKSPKKKFVLKQNKASADAGTPPAADAGTPPADAGTPPAADAGTPPADAGAGTPPTDNIGDTSATDAPTGPNASPDNILLGGGAGTPPTDAAGTPPTDAAGTPPTDAAGTPPTDAAGTPPDDMGTPPVGGEEPSPDMGMDAGSPDMDMGNSDDEGDEGMSGPMGLKTIQKLTGRLSQKLRSFDKEKGMDSQDIKYVLNSIISAIDIAKLDEDDKEDILDKFDEMDEYGEDEGMDLDMGSEDMPMDEPVGDESMDSTPDETMGTPEGIPPSPTFGESTVDKILSKYFIISENERPIISEKRKKTYIQQKLTKIRIKEEIENLSQTKKQMIVSKNFISENKNAKFIGKTNKNNLVFSYNGQQIKVTPNGRII